MPVVALLGRAFIEAPRILAKSREQPRSVARAPRATVGGTLLVLHLGFGLAGSLQAVGLSLACGSAKTKGSM